MIRSLDLASLRGVMNELLAAPPRDMRGTLQQWADANGVRIG
jgi:phosphotransferase system enzyme I (PtsP)